MSMVLLGLVALGGPVTTTAQELFGPQRIVQQTDADVTQSEYQAVYAADLDGDGDQDVLSASVGDDKIAWYENMDGRGQFGPQRVITTLADGAVWVHAADLDGDGDVDVLSASLGDHTVAWYENMNGLGEFGPQRVITTSAEYVYSVYATDLDGDGDVDVLSASFRDDKIAWYENTDGLGTFGPQQVINIADPDGIVDNGNEGDADGARSVYATDLDGDGDIDVLSASRNDGKVAWYENMDGRGQFGPQRVITTSVDGALAVYAGDLDGDGDVDVLSASLRDDKIAWYENRDGLGTFGPQQVINVADPDGIVDNGNEGDADGASSIYATDLDGDGDIDVLSASRNYGKVAWYENLGPPRSTTRTNSSGCGSIPPFWIQQIRFTTGDSLEWGLTRGQRAVATMLSRTSATLSLEC